MAWPLDIIQAMANYIANALWGLIVKNTMDFISNAVNKALPYVAGFVGLILLFVLLLNLF